LLPFLRGLKKNQSLENNKLYETEERPCYWVSGCFMIIKSIDYINAEYFDENTFLYGEEMILAERLKKINRSMYFFIPQKNYSF
jgi:GT2 family glycosyltransferase